MVAPSASPQSDATVPRAARLPIADAHERKCATKKTAVAKGEQNLHHAALSTKPGELVFVLGHFSKFVGHTNKNCSSISGKQVSETTKDELLARGQRMCKKCTKSENSERAHQPTALEETSSEFSRRVSDVTRMCYAHSTTAKHVYHTRANCNHMRRPYEVEMTEAGFLASGKQRLCKTCAKLDSMSFPAPAA